MPAHALPDRTASRPLPSAAGTFAWLALLVRVGVGVGAVAGAGCGRFKPEPPAPFDVVVHVDSDPGKPLPGAAILQNGRDLTTTGKDGLASVSLRGNEGDSQDLAVRCPPDFRSPPKGITVALRRNSGARAPEYTALCPPLVRRVVVAVRAENGANLPVLYLGKEVAKTDASGAAHVLLALPAGDQFELALNTEQNHHLHPQNPATLFVVKAHDDIQPFNVKFTVDKAPPPRVIHHQRPTELKEWSSLRAQ